MAKDGGKIAEALISIKLSRLRERIGRLISILVESDLDEKVKSNYQKKILMLIENWESEVDNLIEKLQKKI